MSDNSIKPSLALSTAGSIVAAGAWTGDGLSGLQFAVPEHVTDAGDKVLIDISAVTDMDTFGAATFADLSEKLKKDGYFATFVGGAKRHSDLLENLSNNQHGLAPTVAPPRRLPIDTLGRIVVEAAQDGIDILTVYGHILSSTFDLLRGRGSVRLASVAHQFQDIVLRAIPIVALISFVVGIILTQQSIVQLKNFGAAIFVVDLSGILMLREVGILLAAIMVAGRSGSAITAEIGSMRMREELDALEVMGLDTYRTIVMPRVFALLTGMPLLGLLGGIAGIVGAALAARMSAGISLETFVTRLAGVVDLHIIIVGMIKAPFMAFAIAIIAINEGLSVSGSTQSLGRHTTAAVVKSIFMVIFIDGLFAVFFGAVGY